MIVADLLIVPFVPRSAVVPWLGAGTTIGLTGSGRGAARAGPPGPRARTRCAAARGPRWPGWPARWPGRRPGWRWRSAIPVTGFLPNVAVTLLASAAVLVAFFAVVALADGGDLRAVRRGRVVRA